jgi:hypothetical protein
MTIFVVVFVVAAALVGWYLSRAGKARQLLRDDAVLADKNAQRELTRKALGTRPAMRDQ